MKNYLIEKGYIPLDKSWTIRMGVLDLLNDYDDSVRFLKKEDQLSDDLQSLYKALIAWKSNEPINVGESATLYRFLRFASWKLELDKKFVKEYKKSKSSFCCELFKNFIKLANSCIALSDGLFPISIFLIALSTETIRTFLTSTLL